MLLVKFINPEMERGACADGEPGSYLNPIAVKVLVKDKKH